jgi:hypothetical protein
MAAMAPGNILSFMIGWLLLSSLIPLTQEPFRKRLNSLPESFADSIAALNRQGK